MKKFLFPALALGLVMTSCQSDEPFAPGMGEEVQATFTISVPDAMGTRAGEVNSAKGGFTNHAGQLNYTVALLNQENKVMYSATSAGNGTSATFSPTVVQGYTYKILAYATFDNAVEAPTVGQTIADTDAINNIATLKGINNEKEDAYFCNGAIEGSAEMAATLKRPFGKLRLVATDYDKLQALGTDVASVKVTYGNDVLMEQKFDTYNQAFEANGGVKECSASKAAYSEDAANELTVFVDYLPAGQTGETMYPFTIVTTYTNGETYKRSFSQDIPVKRNYLTTLRGDFFTTEAALTLEVNEMFANEETINFVSVSNASQLHKAIENVKDGETIKLFSDIKFDADNYYDNGGWKDGLGYTGDKSFTIDLNGYTIGQDGSLNDYLLWIKNVGSKANTITIKNGTLDAGTTAYCALCTASSHDNTLTVNLEDVTLINNISNGSTVKVRAGSVLNVNAGTKIIGKNSYLGIENWNAEVNVYDGAEIYMNGTASYNGCLIGVGGNGTINVYGGYGKGVSGGLIAMTSGGTINVSGGEWIANTDGTYANSNKSVLIAQSDKQYNAGAGNAVVNVTGGTFKGGYNCYGNAVGDAQINISGGNFNANPSSYVADGYSAIEENGVWKVVDGVATAEQLAEMINNATEDITVKFAKDLEGNITLNQKRGLTFTIDGNGKNYKGGIHIFGNGGMNDRWMNIKNINFDGTGLNGDQGCIYTTGSVNGVNSYACNVTIEDCTFTGAGVAAIRQNVGGERNWTIKNCTVASDMHSFLQVSNTNESLVVENCKVYSKNGANLNYTAKASFTGCEFDVKGYAVRVGVNGSNSTETKVFDFTNCTLKSANDDGDAVVIIRQDAQQATLNFVNTTLVGDPKISGATSNTTIKGTY